MSTTASFVTLAGVAVDRQQALPLHRQLYEILRQAILTGQFNTSPGLPSTDGLTQDLSLSRNTTNYVYGQIAVEWMPYPWRTGDRRYGWFYRKDCDDYHR